MSTSPKAILLIDIDSTLVENRFSRMALRTVLQEMVDTTGQTMQALGDEIIAENNYRQANDPDNVLTMDWDDIVNTIAERHDVTLSRPVIELWNEYASADTVDVLDNVHDVLVELQAMDMMLVIATKGLWKYQEPVLQVTGLRDYFEHILTPDITGYLKTSPEYVRDFRAKFPEPPVIHIGDHYKDDVICPLRNGFYSILRAPIDELNQWTPQERTAHIHDYAEQISTYPKDGTDVEPTAVVTSWQEIPETIKQILEL